jgi:hypothetical protein
MDVVFCDVFLQPGRSTFSADFDFTVFFSFSALFQAYFRMVKPVVIGFQPCGLVKWAKFALDE